MYAPFVISGIVWHELSDKIAIVNTNALKDVLNGHLQLDTYGALSGIAFIYIVTQPDDEIHEECFSYSRKNKELYIQMRLPYAEVQSASTPEVLHMMAAKYLQTMQEWLPKKKIPNFNHSRFVADLQDLFERQGWLQVAEVV